MEKGNEAATIGLIFGMICMPYLPLMGMTLSCVCGGMLVHKIMSFNRFTPLFKNLNLCKGEMLPTLKERRITDYSTIYRFSIPPGLGHEDFEKHKARMQDYLGKEITIKTKSRNVFIEVFDEPIGEFDYEPQEANGDVSIIIGRQRNGKNIALDMSAEPHLLIAGETGSGKSTLLRSIITSLILLKDVHLHLIDLKGGCEFQVFRASGKVASFSRTAHEALETLNTVQCKVEERYDLFYNAGAANINEFNKSTQEKIKPEILIIDEFVELQGNKEAMSLIKSICARARACSIYVVVSTQRPDKSVIDGLIKCNICNIIGLKTLNRVNSEVIIDEPGLENLRGNGHGILKSGGKKAEFQAPFISVAQARELIRHTYRETPKRIGEVKKFDFLR